MKTIIDRSECNLLSENEVLNHINNTDTEWGTSETLCLVLWVANDVWKDVIPMDRKLRYELISKLNKLTSQYMELETDDLANAGEFSRLNWKIEELAMQMCILNTDLSENDLIDFLDKHHQSGGVENEWNNGK